MTETGTSLRSVLVVDDEPTLRMAFSFALSDERTLVNEAANGRQALAMLQARPVNVVLMDVRMPEAGGIETVEELRERGDHTPVVLCSAHLTPSDVQRGLTAGVVDFLVKPVGLAQLRETVSMVLSCPESGWQRALSHARRMEFQAAVDELAGLTLSEGQGIWAETFRSLADPNAGPLGFFDPVSGPHRIQTLVHPH